MFFQLALGQAGREVGTVNGNVELLQDIGQRAEVVFMPVGEYHGDNVFAILFEKIEVRNANVNSISGLFRKPHAGVQDDHVIPITHGHAIHSKLADAAERNNL
jgi:hypothetical protein